MRRSELQFATGVGTLKTSSVTLKIAPRPRTGCERVAVAIAAACTLVLFAMASDVRAAPPMFEDAVQAVLATKCGKCHSAEVQKGELDLSSMTACVGAVSPVIHCSPNRSTKVDCGR